jgi:tyrosine-specific transport protein
VCCNLVKEDEKNKNIGILSMAKKTLGPGPALGSGFVYVFIHYALLVAYMAEAGGVLTDVVNFPKWTGK